MLEVRDFCFSQSTFALLCLTSLQRPEEMASCFWQREPSYVQCEKGAGCGQMWAASRHLEKSSQLMDKVFLSMLEWFHSQAVINE